jgi:hypothetical protein
MASFCAAVTRGIKIPLLLVLELTSKAAEAAGVSVPMPTWANERAEPNNKKRQNKT